MDRRAAGPGFGWGPVPADLVDRHGVEPVGHRARSPGPERTLALTPILLLLPDGLASSEEALLNLPAAGLLQNSNLGELTEKREHLVRRWTGGWMSHLGRHQHVKRRTAP